VIGPRRQLQLAYGGLHQGLAVLIQRAVLPDLRRAHIARFSPVFITPEEGPDRARALTGRSPSRLHQIQLRTVLQGFRQMYLRDRLGPSQIGNRPAQLQHSVISPRGQLQLAHGGLHQRLAGFI
jgi:hypothetical protein